MIVDAGQFANRTLAREDVEEPYKPLSRHFFSELLSDEDRKQVAKTRVEIDALLAVVGAEALWKAIEVRVVEEAKIRDLRRSLEPQIPLPSYLSEPIEKIRSSAISFGKPC
jgi:hypothetical protein